MLGVQQIDGGGHLEGSPVRKEWDARVTVMGTDQPVQLGDDRLSGRAVGGRGGGQMPEPVPPPGGGRKFWAESTPQDLPRPAPLTKAV